MNSKKARNIESISSGSDLGGWLTEILQKSNMQASTLAEKLTEYFSDRGKKYYQSTISNMRSGHRKISAEEAIAIETIMGVALDMSVKPKAIPIVGIVHAGGLKHNLIDESHDMGLLTVSSNIKTTEATVAAEIEGDCMGQFFNGWYVLWDQQPVAPSAEVLNKICILKVSDGDILVKKVTRGTIPGTYTLLSQFEPPLYDQLVEWAVPITGIVPRF